MKLFGVEKKDFSKIYYIFGIKIKFKDKIAMLQRQINVLQQQLALSANVQKSLEKKIIQNSKQHTVDFEQCKRQGLELNGKIERQGRELSNQIKQESGKFEKGLEQQDIKWQQNISQSEKRFITKLRENNYEMCLADYKYNGFSENLLNHLQNLAKSKHNWLVENNYLWLLYMQVMIENNRTDDLESIFKKYLHFHETKDVAQFFKVAEYFNKRGFSDDKIIQSSKIAAKLEQARSNGLFAEMIKDKSIAVVGNGPSEIGKSRGNEIDNHDIVVRFNKFCTTGFETDYGTRTDIWVNHSSNNEFLQYPCDFDYKLIMWLFDMMYFRDGVGIDNLSSVIDKPWDIFGYDISKYIWNTMHYYHAPTTGFYFIVNLLKIRGSFDNVDFYGFRFCEQEKMQDMHYFDKENFNNHKWHNFDAEAEFLSNFIKNEGKING